MSMRAEGSGQIKTFPCNPFTDFIGQACRSPDLFSLVGMKTRGVKSMMPRINHHEDPANVKPGVEYEGLARLKR